MGKKRPDRLSKKMEQIFGFAALSEIKCFCLQHHGLVEYDSHAAISE
jgi:hypothetical protein